ncbi:hypothetical protein Q7M_1190 (plasmid) [Borrelia crocidurae str. Achema]|uniref:Variable large protein n=1 Tax=Borrelia crocidurae (strain Achema) TaxID=1155096 RepID=I0FFD2_BORCA|nr:hypothetical protein Q7M_1190 [Borrelia crocidurae str. Achema]
MITSRELHAANTDVLKKVHHALTGIIKAAKTEGIERC